MATKSNSPSPCKGNGSLGFEAYDWECHQRPLDHGHSGQGGKNDGTQDVDAVVSLPKNKQELKFSKEAVEDVEEIEHHDDEEDENDDEELHDEDFHSDGKESGND